MSRIRESNLRITLLDSTTKRGVILGEIFVNLLTLLANRCLTYDLTLMYGEAGHKFRGTNSKKQRDKLVHAVQRSQINGERRNFHVVIHVEMSPYIKTGLKMFDVRLDSAQSHVSEFGPCPWAEYHMSSVRLRWHHATFQDIAKGRVKFEEDASAKFKLKLNHSNRSGDYSESLPSSSDRIVREHFSLSFTHHTLIQITRTGTTQGLAVRHANLISDLRASVQGFTCRTLEHVCYRNGTVE